VKARNIVCNRPSCDCSEANDEESHAYRVPYSRMKNITPGAEEDLIDRVGDVARSRHTTPNSAFRERLQHLASSDGDAASFDAIMQQMSHIYSAAPYTRDHMNMR